MVAYSEEARSASVNEHIGSHGATGSSHAWQTPEPKMAHIHLGTSADRACLGNVTPISPSSG